MKDGGLIHSGKLPRVIAHLLQSLGFVTGVTGWQIEVDGDAEFKNLTVAAVAGADHGALGGLADDDHEQYLKEKGSGGAAAEIPEHDHSAAAEAGTVDHGALDGLADDDHTQYLKEKGSGGLAAEIPEHDHSAAAEGGRVSLGGMGGGKLLWVFDGESLHVHSYPAAWTEVNVDDSNYRATSYGAPNVELYVDEYLWVADAAWQESGAEEFLVWGWCYLGSLDGTNTIAAKWASDGDARSWRLDYGGDDVFFRFIADATGLAGADVITLSSTKGLSLHTWYLVAGYLLPSQLMRIFVGRHDETELTVDSLTVDVPAGLHDGAAALSIGATCTPTNQHEGRLGRVMARSNVAFGNINAYVETLFEAERVFYNEVGPEYILRARFATWDQGYADAQVLDTEGEGVQDGQLTVVEVDGTLAVVSGRCAWTAQSTLAWGDLGLYSQAITRALGRGLVGTFNLTTWNNSAFGWHTAAALVHPDNFEHVLQWRATVGQIDGTYPSGKLIGGLSQGTDYQMALVLGGYDSDGVPWHAGEAAASYLYGAGLFIEVAGTWQLLYRDSTGNTATLYGCLSLLNTVGASGDWLTPDVDLSAVFQPLAKSTFAAVNGTSLDAITPEVGGAWMEHIGNFDIQGNEANVVTGTALATVDAGEADIILVCDVTPVDSSVFDGVVVRVTDAANLWLIRWEQTQDLFRILEINAGEATVRASVADNCAAPPQAYRVTVVTDGQTITAWRDGGSRITYGSAALNESATRHGVRGYNAGSTFDNFHVHALRSDTYEDEFEGAT